MGFSSENIALTLLAPELDGYAENITVLATLPAPSMATTGGNIGVVATLPIPVLRTEDDSNSYALLEVPAPIMSANVLVGGVMAFDLTVPAPITTASYTADIFGQLVVPAPTLSSLLGEIVDINASMTIPAVTLLGSIYVPAGTTRSTYVVNMRNHAHSTYDGFDALGLAGRGSTYYGGFAGGLYTLAGADDAGVNIDAEVISRITDFEPDDETRGVGYSMHLKRLAGGYMNLRTDGDMIFVCIVDEGTRREYTIPLSTASTTDIHPRRINAGRALEGRNWQIGLKNVDGSDFAVFDQEVLPIVLKRRI
jgi:hypothetical protein